MTYSTLRSYTCKDLAQMARSEGVSGWHSMRKEELVSALLKQAKQKKRRRQLTAGLSKSAIEVGSQRDAALQKRISRLQTKLENSKRLTSPNGDSSRRVEHDRLVVMVRDPYWLHVYWEITQQSIERAQSAMGPHWHTAQPTLRLFRITNNGTASLEREIPIHGGVCHWYLDVQNPPSQFRMDIGYLSPQCRFYSLARSNTVSTPPAGTSDSVDENWVDVAENADRIYAMSGGYTPQGTSMELQELLEERLGRPMGTPMETRYGGGAAQSLRNTRKLPFAVDAELLVYGVTDPHAHITLQGEPVPLRSDGSFTVRMTLPDRRQVIPMVASSPDGVEQRTIILAVERNTKELEPRIRDLGK
jgi:uncharacterized protein